MNLNIRPLKWISKNEWTGLIQRFCNTYKGQSKPLSYEMSKFYDIAIAYDGNKQIGYLMLIDYYRLMSASDENTMQSPWDIWQTNRPSTLNRRSIESVMVLPKYRNRGVATELYRYALKYMQATNLHIHESRVFDKIDYFRNMGFTKCCLYTIDESCPSFRLHIEQESPLLFDLSISGMYACFENRGLVMNLGSNKRQRAA